MCMGAADVTCNSCRAPASSAELQADKRTNQATAPPLHLSSSVCKTLDFIKLLSRYILECLAHWRSRASSDGAPGSAEHVVRRLLGTMQAPRLAGACCLQYRCMCVVPSSGALMTSLPVLLMTQSHSKVKELFKLTCRPMLQLSCFGQAGLAEMTCQRSRAGALQRRWQT